MNTCKNHLVVGFTLVEMAMVLVIVGLLLAGLIVPLSAQIEQRNYSDTQKALNEIKDALMGYALSHSAGGRPYFPCPDTDGNGTEDRAGNACTAPNNEGDLPWADLGVSGRDVWNRMYRYRVTTEFADSGAGFIMTSNGNMTVRDASGGNIVASNIPIIILSRGRSGAGGGADETENSNGDATFVSHVPASTAGNEFDDQVAWIPTSIIVNRMVTAGRLP